MEVRKSCHLFDFYTFFVCCTDINLNKKNKPEYIHSENKKNAKIENNNNNIHCIPKTISKFD